VKDDVGAEHGAEEGIVVADVGAVEIEGAADAVEIALVAGEEVVDDRDIRGAASEEAAHEGGSDESGAAGNEKTAHSFQFGMGIAICGATEACVAAPSQSRFSNGAGA
jgi:hypothetical protein